MSFGQFIYGALCVVTAYLIGSLVCGVFRARKARRQSRKADEWFAEVDRRGIDAFPMYTITENGDVLIVAGSSPLSALTEEGRALMAKATE